MNRFWQTASSIAALVAGAGVAHAATYDFTFTAPAGAVLASGTLTTADTATVPGGYAITGITGSVTGVGAITGLIDDPYSPNDAFYFFGTDSISATDPDNLAGYFFDNILFEGSMPLLDGSGLAFKVGDTPVNIFDDPATYGAGPYQYDLSTPSPTATYSSAQGAFAITASVPEPASWMLMIAGFGFVGAAMRWRRPAVRFV